MNQAKKKNLILAIISNYKWDDIHIFFKSLEQTGFTGEVVLFMENINDKTQKMFRKLNYTVHFMPFQRVGLEYTFEIIDYRHYLYYNFLRENSYRYERVLITDVRDVYFQSDPFKASWKLDAITVAKECREIANEIYNTRWILSKFGYHTYSLLQNKIILCAGTTFGPAALIVNYLQEMNAALFGNGYTPWSDQAVHNYLVYSEIVKPVSFADNNTGPIMTLALEDDKNILINANNQLLLRNGSVAPIIHQYDRKYNLVKLISESIS